METGVSSVYADVSCLKNPGLFEYYYGKMPEYRKQKIDGARFLKDKILSLGVGILLKAETDKRGLSAEKIIISQNGKPQLENSSLHFNLSHSGERVFAAFSEGDVGCDVEKIKPVKENLAKRCFFGNEYCDIFRGGFLDTDKFFRYWTLKESFMKLTGKGLSLPLDSFEIFTQNGNISVSQSVLSEKVYFKEYEIEDGYKYSVCATTPHFNKAIKFTF